MILASGRQLIDPKFILNQTDITVGMHVADLGCGSIGHFVFTAADIVGSDGKVYAVDVQKKILNAINSKKKIGRSDQVDHIETVWGDFTKPQGINIPDHSCDLTIIANNLWQTKNKKGLVDEATRITKPEGKLIIIEWKKEDSPLGPDTTDRVSETEATFIFGKLNIYKTIEAGPYHYGLIYKKPKL